MVPHLDNFQRETRPIARQEALRLGLKFYFTGKVCSRGHIAKRRVTKRRCIECERLELRIAYRANPGKRRQKYKAWRDCNLTYNRNRVRKWKKTHPQSVSFLFHKRKAAKLQATPPWVDLDAIRRIYELCPLGLVVDHVIPLQSPVVCGLHVAWNLQYLTPKENQEKGNRLPTPLVGGSHVTSRRPTTYHHRGTAIRAGSASPARAARSKT